MIRGQEAEDKVQVARRVRPRGLCSQRAAIFLAPCVLGLRLTWAGSTGATGLRTDRLS
jgi:hypothetical protein